jgi:hypothetical protein
MSPAVEKREKTGLELGADQVASQILPGLSDTVRARLAHIKETKEAIEKLIFDRRRACAIWSGSAVSRRGGAPAKAGHY